jgi:hypothetical protein
VVQLEITRRARPDEASVVAAFALLDKEHAAVVRSFASATTPLMHKEMREDGCNLIKPFSISKKIPFLVLTCGTARARYV